MGMACVVGSGCGTATADIAKKLGWLLSPHPPPPKHKHHPACLHTQDLTVGPHLLMRVFL